MTQFTKQLTEIECRISEHERIEQTISASSVGWHIEHLLLTFDKIIIELQESKPEDYKWHFNLNRLIVFSIKFIPRGKAESPKVGLPEKYHAERLKKHIQLTRANITNLNTIDSNRFFNHPKFGSLNLKLTIQFLEIHTNHHLRIIDDIIRLKQC